MRVSVYTKIYPEKNAEEVQITNSSNENITWEANSTYDYAPVPKEATQKASRDELYLWYHPKKEPKNEKIDLVEKVKTDSKSRLIVFCRKIASLFLSFILLCLLMINFGIEALKSFAPVMVLVFTISNYWNNLSGK